jgi:hypothetical protein
VASATTGVGNKENPTFSKKGAYRLLDENQQKLKEVNIMAEQEHKIMSLPLPEILDELEAQEKELRDLFTMLKDALERVTAATTEAKQATAEAREAGVKAAAQAEKAAAEAREAGLKAASDFAEALGRDIAEVRKIAEEARDTARLIGTSLMTAADGSRITSETLIAKLGSMFEFKK